MKKTDAIALAGSPGKLAEILGITRQAVSAWPGEHVPELQLYRLRERKPRWFRKPRALPAPIVPDGFMLPEGLIGGTPEADAEVARLTGVAGGSHSQQAET